MFQGIEMIDWDVIGAMAELARAIAVFGSVAYLAVQIRRSSLATAHASQNSFVADYNAQLAQI